MPPSPNDKILLGLIGCGGMGNVLADLFVKRPDVELAAVCDVDPRHGGATADRIEKNTGRRPRAFADFRALLDVKPLDAVIVATPDHWHALCFVHACNAGRDVYCEKPLAHTVAEGRAMVNAAARNRRVVQIGTQQRSGAHFRQAVELVKSGAIGRVVETQTWNLDNSGGGLGRPADGEPPVGVDYDVWLGPAPKRAFNPLRFHVHWRWFWDYGGGMLTDWNVHIQDIVHLAMDAWSPKSVAMSGQIVGDDLRETPDTVIAAFDFDSDTGPFTHTYTLRRTNTFWPGGIPFHEHHGAMFCGRKGTLLVNREGWELVPEKGQGDRRSGGGSDQHGPHLQNFIDCIRSRRRTISDVDSMHRTTTACQLANIAYRVGRRVWWDAEKERCFRDRDLRVPDAEADALLTCEYRKPWEFPV